jgi:hypothetical protein
MRNEQKQTSCVLLPGRGAPPPRARVSTLRQAAAPPLASHARGRCLARLRGVRSGHGRAVGAALATHASGAAATHARPAGAAHNSLEGRTCCSPRTAPYSSFVPHEGRGQRRQDSQEASGDDKRGKRKGFLDFVCYYRFGSFPCIATDGARFIVQYIDHLTR